MGSLHWGPIIVLHVRMNLQKSREKFKLIPDEKKGYRLDHWKFAAVTDNNSLLRAITAIRLLRLNQPHHIHTLQNLTKNNVPLVQPWGLHKLNLLERSSIIFTMGIVIAVQMVSHFSK